MLFFTVLWQLVALMLIAAVGVLLTKLKIIDGELTKGMGNVMTKACLPCLLISNMQIEYNKSTLGIMGSAAGGFLLVMIISAALIMPVILIKKSDLTETGILIICASFPNVVYVGRPLLEAIYGDAVKIPITIITLVFSNTVFSMGVLLATMGNKAENNGVGGLLKKSFINPSVISGVIGILLFLFSVKIPGPILTPMKLMSGMITPLSMIIIGYSLTQTKLKEIIGDWRVYAVAFVRLILTPVAVFFLLSPIISNQVILGTLTVGASLPVGANAGVVARLYNNNPVFAANCIFMSTLLCLVTTPVIVSILLSI